MRYELRHEQGEVINGEWPLPAGGNPQQIGSALTYGRRYTLCAVTGIAPDEDDDGHQASQQRKPEPPVNFGMLINKAQTEAELTAVYSRAQAEGWLDDFVLKSLTERKAKIQRAAQDATPNT